NRVGYPITIYDGFRWMLALIDDDGCFGVLLKPSVESFWWQEKVSS
ncbi:unnamed protein product, partial [Brassica oleracea var. botrytis]